MLLGQLEVPPRYTGPTLITFEEWWQYESRRRTKSPYSARTRIEWHGLGGGCGKDPCHLCDKAKEEACVRAVIHRESQLDGLTDSERLGLSMMNPTPNLFNI